MSDYGEFVGSSGDDEVVVAELVGPKDTLGRKLAVEQGRRLGLAEALSRGEDDAKTKLRVARAMAYAAWDFDADRRIIGGRMIVTRPDDFQPYREEFGLDDIRLMPSLERPDPKPAA